MKYELKIIDSLFVWESFYVEYDFLQNCFPN